MSSDQTIPGSHPSSGDAGAAELERYRTYLLLLARMEIGREDAAKLEASDVVQQTLLAAHRKREQFRGGSEAEQAVWLRQILAHKLKDAWKALGRAKRDVKRQVSVGHGMDQSSAGLEQWVAAEISSPSQRAQRHELVLMLADGLTCLSDQQRDALVMRHCRGMSLNEIGEELGCNVSSAAGLIARGSLRLREWLRERGIDVEHSEHRA